jgi:hypothetical protein
MSWVRIDDQAPEHPKMLKAGPTACWLWVCGNAWCSRHLTNGEIPRAAVALFPVPHQFREAARLVDARIWEKTNTGYRVHDYLEYHPSAAQVKRRRRQIADRVAHWKVTHRKVGKNSKGSCVTDHVSNGVTEQASNAPGTPATLPDSDPKSAAELAAPPLTLPVEHSSTDHRDLSRFTPPAELAPKNVENTTTGNGVTGRVTNAPGTHAPDPVPDPDPLREERTAAPPPSPPVKHSVPHQRDLSRFTPPSELAPFAVVSALTRGLLAEGHDWRYAGGEADLLDTIKTRCAKARLGYDTELVRKALDSERVKAGHRRSA